MKFNNVNKLFAIVALAAMIFVDLDAYEYGRQRKDKSTVTQTGQGRSGIGEERGGKRKRGHHGKGKHWGRRGRQGSRGTRAKTTGTEVQVLKPAQTSSMALKPAQTSVENE